MANPEINNTKDIAEEVYDSLNFYYFELSRIIEFDDLLKHRFKWIFERLEKIKDGKTGYNNKAFVDYFDETIQTLFRFLRKEGYTLKGHENFNESVLNIANELGGMVKEVASISINEEANTADEDYEEDTPEVKELKLIISKLKTTLFAVIGITAIGIGVTLYKVGPNVKKLRDSAKAAKVELKECKQEKAEKKEMLRSCIEKELQIKLHPEIREQK